MLVGLFYRVPDDLKAVADIVGLVGGEMNLRGRGYGTPGLIEEYLPEAIEPMQSARDRLIAEGRAHDLVKFRRHLLRTARYMENGPYNVAFRPFVLAHLTAQPGSAGFGSVSAGRMPERSADQREEPDVALAGAGRLNRWLGPRRSTVVAIVAGSAARRATAALSRMRRVRAALAAFVTVAVPVGQALAVGLCFLGGNYLSIAFDSQRQQQVTELVGSDPYGALQPERFAEILTLDWISAGYLMLATVIVVKSYSWALYPRPDSNRLSNAAAAMAFPAVILLGLAAAAAVVLAVIILFGLVLTALSDGDGIGAYLQQSLRNAIPLIAGAAICGLYYGACQAAVRGSRLVVNAYRNP